MFRTVKISQKIPVIVITFVVLPILITLIAINSANKINQGGQEIHDNYLVSIVNLTDTRKHLFEEFVWLKSHIISPNEAAMLNAERQIQQSNSALRSSLEKFAQTLDPGEETERYQALKSKLTKLNQLKNQIIELSRTNNDTEADNIANNQYRQLFTNIQQEIQNIFKTNVDGAQSFYQLNQETFANSQTLLISVAMIIIVVGIFLGWLLISSIQKPLSLATEKVKEINQSKNLNLQLMVDGDDEITELSSTFNVMIGSLREVIGEIDRSNTVLSDEANALLNIIESANNNLMSSSQMLDEVQHSTSEITDSIDEIARSAAQASSEAENSTRETSAGMALQQQTINSVDSLKTNMSGASAAIEGLSKDSDAIGSVLDVIRGIAEQTNLLALNAAIEAARAGEQGRGFAVVADEVRSLAQRTQESTSEIQSMIEKLQSGAHSSVEAMQESVKSLDETAQLTEKTEQSIQNIINIINNISLMNDQIASATEQQSVAVKEISSNVSQANQLSQTSANSFESIKVSSAHLNEIVDAYANIMAKFKA